MYCIVEIWLDNRRWTQFKCESESIAIYHIETALVCAHMTRSVTVYYY